MVISQKNRYINLLQDAGVSAVERPAYVREVEAFLRALRPASLHDLPAEKVRDYLESLNAREDLRDEEVRRAIGALRLLLVQFAQTPAGGVIDWPALLERRSTTTSEGPEAVASEAGITANEKSAAPITIGAPRILRAARTYPVLNELAQQIQDRHYSLRTEQSYIDWCHRFLAFCGDGGGANPEPADVQRFLQHLERDCALAPKTQSLAYNAVAFLFEHVFETALEPSSIDKPRRKEKPPTILDRSEVRALLETMTGTHGLMARLIYGTGLRLMECVRLRIRDLDFAEASISVKTSQGEHDRGVPIPQRLLGTLNSHLQTVVAQHEADTASGVGAVCVPSAVASEDTEAVRRLEWQYCFPSGRLSRDASSGYVGRAPMHASSLQRALKGAGETAGIASPVNAQALRHAFAAHLLVSECDIRTVQTLLGHSDVSTTMRYARLAKPPSAPPVTSPIDTI